MTRRIHVLSLAAVLVAFLGAGCLDKKILELVLTGETSADFSESETSATDVPEVVTINVAERIREILDENGIDISQIREARVTSIHYGVTSFDQGTNWVVSGEIRIRRIDVPAQAVIVAYTDQSIPAALGQKIPAPLEQPGVQILNDALADFLDDQDPVLQFEVQHGAITPAPTLTNPMIFEWRAWLAIQLIVEQEVEVPDPF